MLALCIGALALYCTLALYLVLLVCLGTNSCSGNGQISNCCKQNISADLFMAPQRGAKMMTEVSQND